jgi:preprotein translocase subunit SecG
LLRSINLYANKHRQVKRPFFKLISTLRLEAKKMATTLLTVVHILITLTLIFLVLLQDSKGGGLGGLSGGNANTFLGATGATTLAAKFTRWTAVAFAISCLTLAVLTSKSKKSVIDDLPVIPKSALGASVNTTPIPTAVAPTETTEPSKTSEQKTDSTNPKK